MKKKDDFEHGGNLKEIKDSFSLSKQEIIDFSANINFLGIPESVKKALQKEINNLIHYPQPRAEDFKKELSKNLNIKKERIIAGNGAAELIYLLLDYLKIDKILLPVPSFSEYEKAAYKIDADLEFFYLREKDDFSLDVSKLKNYLKRNDLIILNNPHNPSGQLYNKDKLVKILNIAQKEDVFVVVDEAFIDFRENESKYSLIKEIDHFDNLFILRSLTKFFAIPGLRLGYGLGSSELIAELEKRRDPWTVNSLAQTAGNKAINDKDYIKKSKIKNKEQRKFLYKKLNDISDLRVYKPSVNFILLKIEKNLTAEKLRDKMASQGIVIRDCSNFRGLNNSYFRIAVKSREENLRLLRVLKNSLEKV
ncbi:MAG: threonine-phosphate decarboxylase CobD [Bacillota bacterium]